ncbi:transketolase family protein [Sediminispirochaeta smaragdinae]|uniref:Transketolase central region n=1 Tax=Sediminispirochaeta smaragdinae (strain DSM 11293 / JCM 15392 / SEBR 4228) TaxID=573413 RepID=E1RCT0_SEDSS|nr:transketolase C-terminal domain-containing protein [Sediminispirochaeta smaragdinae]ADK80160.1 Transketolase central region [Sediminispirochaeta smaragdinae DSM 11293]
MKAGLRETMVEVMTEEAEKGKNLVVMVSDSTSTSKIQPFQEKFPEKVVNVGIAEQNLIGAAAGMALGGMIPITANAAPFLIGRSNEQVKNDICYSNTNVKLVGLNPGFAYGPLGPTHHCIDDISVMRGFGNITIFTPQDPREVRALFHYLLSHEGPAYIRLDSFSCENLPGTSENFKPGALTFHRGGSGDDCDLAIICLGTASHAGLAAAERLASEGINAAVVGISSIRPIDRGALSAVIASCGRVLTVEEHSAHGGIGSLAAEVIAENGLSAILKRLAIPEGQFAPASPVPAIQKAYQLDSEGIVAATHTFLRQTRKDD